MSQIQKFLSSLSDGMKYHGGHAEETKVHLRAGNLQMVYQKGSLRHIGDGEHEIVRMVYSAVRDKDWLTADPFISCEEFDIRPDSFRINFLCSYRTSDLNFIACYTIEGTETGSVYYSMDGEAVNSFMKNRIGFCVLHPVEECAGRICHILDTSNKTGSFEFPRFISPDPPFRDIKSMTWTAGSINCRIDFQGDVFETEDQRNWTDASYKTYCTPLDLPSPVLMEKGTKVRQSLGLIVEGTLQGIKDTSHTALTIEREIISGIPPIGLGRSTRETPLSEYEIDVLRNLDFDHYRVDLLLSGSGWKDIAETAATEASRLKVPLELALFFNSDVMSQAEDLIDWITFRKPDIRVILIFHQEELVTPVYLQEVLPAVFRKVTPRALIGFGTNANFAELNRERPSAGLNDLVCYSVHPQEHATDNETLVENLRGQGYTAESAGQFAGGKGVWISPVNIQRRFNANIEAYEKPVLSDVFPAQADSRLMSLFGAGWTGGSFKYLAEEGVAGITFFETVGERGIIQGDEESRWPNQFASVKGMIFPVYHIFRFLLMDKSFKLIKSKSSKPLVTDCIFLLKEDNRLKGLIMNFTPSEQKIIVKGTGSLLRVKRLDKHTFSEAASDQNWLDKDWQEINLPGGTMGVDAYSILFVEGSESS